VEHAGSALEKMVADTLRRAPQDEAAMLAWPLACGSRVAERTRAIAIEGGTLRVEVPDAGWKRELQVLAPRYVAALNRFSSQKVIYIDFVIRKS